MSFTLPVTGLNWTKVGLKALSLTITVPFMHGLNWTKVGLKVVFGVTLAGGVTRLNWTKVGLKGNNRCKQFRNAEHV